MSGDCAPIDTETPQDSPSKPFVGGVVADARGSPRARSSGCRRRPGRDLAGDVDLAGREQGLDGDPAAWASCRSRSSRIASLIWSAILSGWPSVTDSDVNRRRPRCAPLQVDRRSRTGRRPTRPGIAPTVERAESSTLGARRCGHDVPDDVGDGAPSGPAAPRARRRRRDQDDGLVVGRCRSPSPRPTSLTTSRSQPLRASLSRPCSSTSPPASPVSAANPTTTWPGAPRRPTSSARTSGCCSSATRRGPAPVVVLLDLGAGSAPRAEVGDRGGHRPRRRRPRPPADRLPQLGGRARRARRATPAGSGSATLAATRVTSAPRGRRGRGQRVRPAGRWTRLPRNRTGSSGSRVPPARHHDVRPARSAAAPPRPQDACTARRQIARGLGQPALAGVGAGEPPAGGLEHDARRAPAACATLACGGGVLPHLGVHRRGEHDRAAGGEQDVGEQVVGQAVGGPGQQVGGGRRDDDEVGLLADPHVRHLVHVVPHSVATGLPDSAAQVAAPTNCRAAAVGTTVTSWPASVRPQQDLAGLVGGDAAGRRRGRRAGLASRVGSAGSVEASISRRRGRRRARRAASTARRRSRSRSAGVDLAQGDRQRLLLHVGLDQRADVLEQALAELGVVGVDLAGPLGGVDDQGVLGVGLLEQLVDRRMGDALGARRLRSRRSLFDGERGCRGWAQASASRGPAAGRIRRAWINATKAGDAPRHRRSRARVELLLRRPARHARRGQPARDRVRRLGAAPDEPGLAALPRRRGQEDQQRLGHAAAAPGGRPAARSPAAPGGPASSRSSHRARAGCRSGCRRTAAHSSIPPAATSSSNSLVGDEVVLDRPSTSPGRGARVVAETDSQILGRAAAGLGDHRALAHAGRPGDDHQRGLQRMRRAPSGRARGQAGAGLGASPARPRRTVVDDRREGVELPCARPARRRPGATPARAASSSARRAPTPGIAASSSTTGTRAIAAPEGPAGRPPRRAGSRR